MGADNKKTSRRLTRGMATILALTVALTVTTIALTVTTAQIAGNVFSTGTVKIDLWDMNGNSLKGKSLIDAQNLGPGATIRGDFQVVNIGSANMYYKLYFDDVSGGLADVLDVTITKYVDGAENLSDIDESQIVYSTSKLSEMEEGDTSIINEALKRGGSQGYTVWFHFPEEAKNPAQNLSVSFSFNAEAVQKRNYDGSEFS